MKMVKYTRYSGTYFANKYGKLGDGCLTIRKSNMKSAGKGVFTNKFIRKDTVITEYTGYQRRSLQTSDKNKYLYTLKNNHDLVGIKDISKLYGRGIAQLTNDVISENLTQKKNNTRFVEIDNKVYIKATRNIEPNEELYVCYGLDYWLYEFNRNGDLYDVQYREWFIIIERIKEIWNNYSSANIYYIGESRMDELCLEIEIQIDGCPRYCPYHSIISDECHENDIIVLKIIKKRKGGYEMFYQCNICSRDDHLISKFDF